MKEHFYLIEEVAQKAGLTKRTLRYYEEQGLLTPATRTLKGYRLYDEEDFKRLCRIRELRETMGFALTEVKEVLNLEDILTQLREVYGRGEVPNHEKERLLELKDSVSNLLAVIAIKKARLEEIQEIYKEKLERIDNQLRGLE